MQICYYSRNAARHNLVAGLMAFLFVAAPIASATPSIWYSGVRDEVRLTWIYEDVPFDMNGDGANDFLFRHDQDTLNVSTLSSTLFLAEDSIFQSLPPLWDGTIEPTPISGKAWEDGLFGFYSSQVVGGGVPVTTGPWQDIDHGMFGISFESDGDTHYGWVRLSTGIDGNYTRYILHDWAYETQPGVGIMAGTVPEPSTWALFLCGGACLLGRLRLRRKSARS